ncbi:MAG: response regulator transcription factor [Anaerolineae bacterium]|nr:response regulator transcription factor [Anaerolineae bacterium]
MEAKIRILIVDDHPLVREGLQAVLALEPDMEVIGQAADGLTAVRLVSQLHPDVVLMDLLMPEMSGGKAISAILARQNPPRVLVLTSVEDLDTLGATIKAGASGYVSKNAPSTELLNAIRTVYRGSIVLPASLATVLLRDTSAAISPPNIEELLTERELEVLKLVAQGFDNNDIANQLVISSRTVSVHVSRILAKLGLENRTQAALYALRTGFVTLK